MQGASSIWNTNRLAIFKSNRPTLSHTQSLTLSPLGRRDAMMLMCVRVCPPCVCVHLCIVSSMRVCEWVYACVSAFLSTKSLQFTITHLLLFLSTSFFSVEREKSNHKQNILFIFIFALCEWYTENCVQKNMKQKKVSAYCKRRQSVAEAAAANRRYVAKAQSQWWQSTIVRDSVERRRI